MKIDSERVRGEPAYPVKGNNVFMIPIQLWGYSTKTVIDKQDI